MSQKLQMLLFVILYALFSCAGSGGKRSVTGTKTVDSAQTVCTGPGCNSVPGAPQNEGGLPAYLVSYADADAIKTIVEAYRKPTFEKDVFELSTAYGDLRGFTESFLNKLMAQDSLQPGRTLAVSIIENADINAFSDPFQRVGINKPTIQYMNSAQVLSVLCHELAHSALNHVMKRMDFYKQNKNISDAMDAADAYLQSTYNTATGRYTHNLAAYKTARKSWDAVQPRMSVYRKTNESQADIYGGMICGQAGMKSEDYRQGVVSFLQRADQLEPSDPGVSRGPDDLKDGESFQVSATDAYDFLFQTDTHPTNDERNGQLTRLSKPIDKFYKQSTMASDWNASYNAMGGGKSMSLFDEPITRPGIPTSEGGVILVPRKRN